MIQINAEALTVAQRAMTLQQHLDACYGQTVLSIAKPDALSVFASCLTDNADLQAQAQAKLEELRTLAGGSQDNLESRCAMSKAYLTILEKCM